MFALSLALAVSRSVMAGETIHDVVVDRGIVFGTGGEVELKLDLARPRSPGQRPGVVILHGGAWRLGDHRMLSARSRFLGTESSVIEYFAARGFVAVTAQYRLVPKAVFPAPLEDGKAAVRWLRANADRYGVNPNLIAACGYSAGGHLAALLGLTNPSHGYEGTGGNAGQSSQVQAVIDLFGPTDLASSDWHADAEEGVLAPLIGARLKDKPELFRGASPLTYVTKTAPPFYIAHGTRDPVVPPVQSKRLADRLTEAGVKHRYVEVPGEGHGWFGPKLAKTLDEAIAFLREQFKA
ncbi:MAG: alpha/beta hydrolase [Gemmataceae bacterium]